MRNYSLKQKIALVSGLALILAIFVTRPASSQEAAKKETYKKITMKVVSDNNGKITVIDTTMEMTDTAMVDSLQNEIEKVIVLGNRGKHARFKYRNMPGGYNYDFEIPCPPDGLRELEELEGLDWEEMMSDLGGRAGQWDHGFPLPDRRIIRSGGDGATLNDILGRIPMDRVVSYSIKDRKGGKRIVIDLNDAPMFERQEQVIVIREPGRRPPKGNNSQRKVRVIVNTDGDDMNVENASGQPAPSSVEAPPPPPPPPPAKQGKK